MKKHYQKSLFLALIAALFVLPYVSAHFFYNYHVQWSAKHSNNGILLNPPLNLQTLGISQDKKWLISYIYPKHCQQTCLQQMDFLNRLRLAFGSDSRRINVGLITSIPLPGITQMKPIESSQLLAWLKKFPQPIYQGFIISDPHGNVILYYPDDVKPKAMFDDLKQLLKVSQIG